MSQDVVLVTNEEVLARGFETALAGSRRRQLALLTAFDRQVLRAQRIVIRNDWDHLHAALAELEGRHSYPAEDVAEQLQTIENLCLDSTFRSDHRERQRFLSDATKVRVEIARAFCEAAAPAQLAEPLDAICDTALPDTAAVMHGVLARSTIGALPSLPTVLTDPVSRSLRDLLCGLTATFSSVNVGNPLGKNIDRRRTSLAMQSVTKTLWTHAESVRRIRSDIRAQEHDRIAATLVGRLLDHAGCRSNWPARQQPLSRAIELATPLKRIAEDPTASFSYELACDMAVAAFDRPPEHSANRLQVWQQDSFTELAPTLN